MQVLEEMVIEIILILGSRNMFLSVTPNPQNHSRKKNKIF